jgi:hypothetical protein
MSWQAERARLAFLTRSREPDDPDLVEARRNLRAERLAEHVRKVVAGAPKLTPEQRDRIAAILRGAVAIMRHRGVGPPGKEVGPDAANAEANQQVSNDTTTADNDNRPGRQRPYDALVGNRRRFGASRRMVPLPTCVCGRCVRDPDLDRHRCGDEITDHMAEAAVAAVEHLNRLGMPALLDDRTCRAMWRVGRRDLAVAVQARTSGAVA